MPKPWKWKLGLLIGLVIYSAYLLAPTFLGFQGLREEAVAKEAPLPWYLSLFPDKGLNLGLDLQGGIYLEFEVEIDRAVANKVDLLGFELERELKAKNISYSALRQETQKHTLVLTFDSIESAAPAEQIVEQQFNNALVRQSKDLDAKTITFALQTEYADYLADQISKQALEKVRNRIDRYGVAEPSIQRLGSNRIAVELPGVKDPDRAINLIKQAGQLEFKIVNESLSEAALTTLMAEARATDNIPKDDFSTATSRRLTELLTDKLPADTEIAFELQYDRVSRKVSNGLPYLLNRRADVSGEMLKNAQTNVQNNEPYVSLTFDGQGTALFGEATKQNVGKRLAIVLDGVVNSAPVIREPILGGQAQITLGFGSYAQLLKECEDLVLVLQEGALPAQLTEATKTVVGPSLGADSIRKGVTATTIGGLVVALFMLFYYRLSGFVANAALFLNLVFILAALTLFQATLTLPGIAGIVLTLGMAVDANVLIFERIREELRAGKDARSSINAGYQNAMRAIIDSNVTTLISAVVLYQFGTGPVRGFAVTLMIGLAISMYTACVCTRMVYDYFLITKKIAKVSV